MDVMRWAFSVTLDVRRASVTFIPESLCFHVLGVTEAEIGDFKSLIKG